MANGLGAVTLEPKRQNAQQTTLETKSTDNRNIKIESIIFQGGEKSFNVLSIKPNENSPLEITHEGKTYTKQKITRNGKSEYVYILFDGGHKVAPKEKKDNGRAWYNLWNCFGLLDETSKKWDEGIDNLSDGLDSMMGIDEKATHVDEADDGKISGSEKLAYVVKGAVVDPTKAMVKNPVKTAVVAVGTGLAIKGIAAGCAAAGIACPPLGAILAAGVAIVGLGILAWNGFKALKGNFKTDAEARAAYRGIGTGTGMVVTAGLTAKGMSKGSLKQKVTTYRESRSALLEQKKLIAEAIKQNPARKNDAALSAAREKAIKDTLALRQDAIVAGKKLGLIKVSSDKVSKGGLIGKAQDGLEIAKKTAKPAIKIVEKPVKITTDTAKGIGIAIKESKKGIAATGKIKTTGAKIDSGNAKSYLQAAIGNIKYKTKDDLIAFGNDIAQNIANGYTKLSRRQLREFLTNLQAARKNPDFKDLGTCEELYLKLMADYKNKALVNPDMTFLSGRSRIAGAAVTMPERDDLIEKANEARQQFTWY